MATSKQWSSGPLAVVLLAAAVLFAGVPPAAAATRPVSVGANANYEQNLARSANLGWSRIDLLWDTINPQAGVWNFAATDAQINVAVANGQQILAILHSVPAWANGGQNTNVPPTSTTAWAEFVRRVAQRYRGRIAAYEIWNEPDQKSTGSPGIGWGRDIEERPLYVDFVHAAAVEIRAQAPGTLVVAPAFQSRYTSSGSDNRKRRILQQIQAAVYADGAGPSFIDVISIHNNAQDDEPSRTQGVRLVTENLRYVQNHAPSLRNRPVWVTEYGWRSNAVGLSGQREKICNLTKIYTGLLEASYTGLGGWDVRRGFIYVLKAPGVSSSIFNADNSPKPVVTQYLQALAYPALQQPALSAQYPSCAGTGAQLISEQDLASALETLGLSNLEAALPTGFGLSSAEVSETGGISALYTTATGDTIDLMITAATPDNEDRRSLTAAGAEWVSKGMHLALAGSEGDLPLGNAAVAELAGTLDRDFADACVVESREDDKADLSEFGFEAPALPEGWTLDASRLEITRPVEACPDSKSAVPDLDLSWAFSDGNGNVIRVGAYRYDGGRDRDYFVEDQSFHWTREDGISFYVASDSPLTRELQALLETVARKLDPAFPG